MRECFGKEKVLNDERVIAGKVSGPARDFFECVLWSFWKKKKGQKNINRRMCADSAFSVAVELNYVFIQALILSDLVRLSR